MLIENINITKKNKNKNRNKNKNNKIKIDKKSIKFSKKNKIVYFNNKKPTLYINKKISNMKNIENIFKYNDEKYKNMNIYLEKQTFNVWYSKEYKYPILVKEDINKKTGITDTGSHILRKDIEDPFKSDDKIPKKYNLEFSDYETMMIYGLSPGHMTPAVNHKKNMNDYMETFQLSNIVPQDISFNSGIWVAIENWCKDLKFKRDIENISVYTGVYNHIKKKIKNEKKQIKTYYVPDDMFKIVLYNKIYEPDITYYVCFSMKNKPYYFRSDITRLDLSKNLMDLGTVCKNANIDINKLLTYHNLQHNKGIQNLVYKYQDNLRLNVILNVFLKKQLIKSFYYGKLINSKSSSELEYYWSRLENIKDKIDNDIEYHREYYDLAKLRFSINEI